MSRSPDAHPETRICMQVVYESIQEKLVQEGGKQDRGGKEEYGFRQSSPGGNLRSSVLLEC